MSQQSAFDRQHIEESAVGQQPGLLEQLNLPPAWIAFIRKNQRNIWIAVGCIALIVVSAALYRQYTGYREDKAAIALTTAMQDESGGKQELLARVVDEYGGTDAGLWARIELAHLAIEQDEVEKAIRQFNDIQKTVSSGNPVTPLLLSALGALYEKNDQPEEALAAFNKLSAFTGFAASAYEAMGRLYETRGDKAKALEMYRKALGTPGGEGEDAVLPAGNPNRETIQARINYLQD